MGGHLETRRILAIGLEFSLKVASLELLGESLVFTPESADVIYGKLDHGQAF